MEYELVVVWATGEKEIHTYKSEEEAEKFADGFRMAFGQQVAWAGTRRKLPC